MRASLAVPLVCLVLASTPLSARAGRSEGGGGMTALTVEYLHPSTFGLHVNTQWFGNGFFSEDAPVLPYAVVDLTSQAFLEPPALAVGEMVRAGRVRLGLNPLGLNGMIGLGAGIALEMTDFAVAGADGAPVVHGQGFWGFEGNLVLKPAPGLGFNVAYQHFLTGEVTRPTVDAEAVFVIPLVENGGGVAVSVGGTWSSFPWEGRDASFFVGRVGIGMGI